MALVLGDSLRTSPKCHREFARLSGDILFSLGASDVSLDVDLSRSGRVKSKGKDKVTRSFAVGNVRRVNAGCSHLQALP